MRIIQTNNLSEEQKLAIVNLEKVCFAKESLENHLYLSNEINFNRSIPTFFLAYEQELIGFLTFFIPTNEEAEISAVVHPDYQRRGVFSDLDKQARSVIAENGIGRIIYCVEAKSKDAKKVLKAWNIKDILRTEYRMILTKQRIELGWDKSAKDAEFSVLRVSRENVNDYISISKKVYAEDGNEFINTILSSNDRFGYVFYKDQAPVGIFSIGLETKNEPFIYGVAIDENKRGLGYGRLMMQQACTIGTQYGDDLRLDVDSENPIAFNLYKSLGFETTLQVDYYLR